MLYGGCVAWIRRVRTGSGATAVQVADYVNGRRRIVAHVGSAHTEAELGLLMRQAQELLEDPGQGEFDLGLAPLPVKADLVGPVENDDGGLFARQDAPERGAGRADRPVVTRAQVVATGSEVLFQALAGVFTDLGFAPVTDECSDPW